MGVASSPLAPGPSSPARRALLLAAVGVWLIGMTAIGLPRAVSRHFHIDEVQVAYNIALSSVHGIPDYCNGIVPVVVPLGWLVSAFHSTAAMLIALSAAVAWHRSILAWHVLLCFVLAVVLFVPISRYSIAIPLPFGLELYRIAVALVLLLWVTSLLVDPTVRLRPQSRPPSPCPWLRQRP